MTRFLKKKITAEDLGLNPFVQPLQFEVKWKTLSGQFKKMKEGILVPNEILMEREPTCKVYTSAAHRKHVMEKLKPTAAKLYLWLIYDIDYALDYHQINKKRCMEEVGISLNTYKAAVIELKKAAIITETVEKDIYWINPSFFFKGDRIKKYPECAYVANEVTRDMVEEKLDNHLKEVKDGSS